jgi:Xaa-Pro aminopeptidase
MNNTHHRLASLRTALREHRLEALLITVPANCRYISGFSGSSGALLVSESHAFLFTDFRYRIQAKQEAPAFTLREVTVEKPLHRLLVETASEVGVQQVGFESHHVTVNQFTRFVKTIEEHEMPVRPALVPVEDESIVEALREVKDADEVDTLRRAAAITDEALAAVLPLLTPEHTERQAAWMLEVAVRERGADGIAFPIIVAAGTNAARPHAHPGDAVLGAGQPVIIDMGAVYHGYHADLTRTVVLGAADDRFHHVYQTVLEAQQHAISQLRAGMKSAEADALARDRIAAAGFGDAFGHSLGHGVGLHIHEGPTLRRTNDKTLRTGSVLTVEPGIYLEGWGGVRIEDLVLLREDSCELLSHAPR